ncbi:hypothetical protein MCOR27_009162 [Pyricularia oryzae]|uniref:Uncharacterized protein n=3 Tax=Pyricularia TaxID=48558 RepID=A0ABQ8NAB0_PYRGI|nr:hypothetical protein OOU_Y34scaffold00283g4 [Pyricularia oryzae Y34]KAH8841971.1 hypothetical protein MCOR01_005913 [Pyricularia oryzae]KAI6293828.1 hypothetical protein MCOR33_008852 [Pyricularia grisea]KAI6252166.1 hypothetical protein MCOR19_011217 [Pyricularia oryzae]KAI6265090.1 hypothetical protein MCOR26_010938 [Pyricularia oryzae]
MSSTAGFPAFGLLPTELQLQIWKEALAPVAVLDFYVRPQTGGRKQPHAAKKLPPVALDFYGAKPHNAGLSCKAARLVMEQTYGPPVRLAGSANACWVNLDRAVVHLSEPVNAAAILDALEPDVLPRVRHIVLAWRSQKNETMIDACKAVATRCKNLETLTFNPYFTKRHPAQGYMCKALDDQITAFYSAIPEYIEPPWWDFSMDLLQTKSRLLPYFDTPRPKMHMVPFHILLSSGADLCQQFLHLWFVTNLIGEAPSLSTAKSQLWCVCPNAQTLTLSLRKHASPERSVVKPFKILLPSCRASLERSSTDGFQWSWRAWALRKAKMVGLVWAHGADVAEEGEVRRRRCHLVNVVGLGRLEVQVG